MCDALIAEFPSFESGQSANERGERGRNATHPEPPKLAGAYRRVDRLMRDADSLAGGRITSIPDLPF